MARRKAEAKGVACHKLLSFIADFRVIMNSRVSVRCSMTGRRRFGTIPVSVRKQHGGAFDFAIKRNCGMCPNGRLTLRHAEIARRSLVIGNLRLAVFCRLRHLCSETMLSCGPFRGCRQPSLT